MSNGLTVGLWWEEALSDLEQGFDRVIAAASVNQMSRVVVHPNDVKAVTRAKPLEAEADFGEFLRLHLGARRRANDLVLGREVRMDPDNTGEASRGLSTERPTSWARRALLWNHVRAHAQRKSALSALDVELLSCHLDGIVEEHEARRQEAGT